jgi:hypothetical protein
MMLNFRHIGEWNPQLLRELKSRLNWRNGSIAMAVSVVGQLLLLLSQFSKLPGNSQPKYMNSGYCLTIMVDECDNDSFGNVLVNWPQWWTDVSVNISWLMFLGLFVGGVYSLASSFSQEEKRGTLDFIRLTPQKASTILLGKLFGVPILVYLGTALALPLQFHAVNQANISLIHVLSWDVLMVAVAFMLYLGAMLVTMWFKAQSILLAAAALLAAYQVISLGLYWSNRSYSIYSRSDVEWYGMVLGNRLSYYLVFTGLAIAGIYWLYQALERRYLQPQSTVLSKGQSYLWSLMFHLFAIGFFFSSYSYGDEAKNRLLFHVPFDFGRGNSSSSFGAVVLVTFGLFWLLLLVPVLLPSRQSLVEWSRHGSAKTHWLRSLVWDDKSPAVLAVAINMAIVSMVWLIAIALSPNRSSLPKMLLGCLITMTLVAIYSSIAHWVLFWPVNNRPAWITGIVGGLVFLPLVGAEFIPWIKDFLYLFSPFLWESIRNIPFFGVLLVWGLQLPVLAWLTMWLRKVLTKVGHSESYQNFVA